MAVLLNDDKGFELVGAQAALVPTPPLPLEAPVARSFGLTGEVRDELLTGGRTPRRRPFFTTMIPAAAARDQAGAGAIANVILLSGRMVNDFRRRVVGESADSDPPFVRGTFVIVGVRRDPDSHAASTESCRGEPHVNRARSRHTFVDELVARSARLVDPGGTSAFTISSRR